MHNSARIAGLIVGMILFGSAAALRLQATDRHLPEVRLATLAELKASVPKELLDSPREDKAGRARYSRLIALAKSLNQRDVTQVMLNWSELRAIASGHHKKGLVSKEDQLTLVKRVWKANPRLVPNLESILVSGPLTLRIGVPSQDYDSFLPLVNLARFLAFSAESYAEFSEFQTATRLLALQCKLERALISAQCSKAMYLGNILILGIGTAKNDIIARSTFPPQSCAEILKAVRPAPIQDQCLVLAIKEEFLHEILPDLAMNKPAIIGAGSYDAIETVKQSAKSSLIAIANARIPFNKAEVGYFRQLAQDANVVLRGIDQRNYQGPYSSTDLSIVIARTLDEVNPAKPKTPRSQALRSNLNRIHNSLGRLLLGQNVNENLPALSCNWRVERDLKRILLASRIYRAKHRGNLPPTIDGFVPILGQWPNNPFNGKPFTYLPKQEVVYGVGQDLIDHGGRLAASYPSGRDVGISLKLAK